NLPFSFIFFNGASRLYRSEDFGKTFTDVSKVLKNYYIRKEFGINVGPENSKKVILTADVSKLKAGGAIFRSSDSGETFEFINLPFHPSQGMTFHPSNPSQLLAYCIKVIFMRVCVSVHVGMLGGGVCLVCACIWCVCVVGVMFSVCMYLACVLLVILCGIYVSYMCKKSKLKTVSHNCSVCSLQFYSILGADNEMIFMHVDEPGNTGFGTIYTSDDRGILFSKSLERHLFVDSSGANDFTNVTSLRGVYITNVLDINNTIRSVITFDSGGEWRALKRPSNSQCDKTAKNPEQCSLHIHSTYSISQKVDVPVPPLTAPNAVGVVIAHGSVGDVISTLLPNVYVSDDGGYTWWKALNGPHYYTMLDSGGLIVALESHPDRAVQVIKYSTDEGQCWHSYNFTNETFMFVGLVSEPGAKSMNVSLWGYKQENLYKTTWLSYTIDFNELLTRDCDERDYVLWLAHSTDFGSRTDGCILGCKERYQRLAKSSVCRNGRDYELSKEQAFCQCTLADYMCDFGYYRVGNDEKCVEQSDLKDKVLEFCLKGKEELLNTQGGVGEPRCIEDIYEGFGGLRCETVAELGDVAEVGEDRAGHGADVG
uniref:Sortilin-like n=1 Tax=Callorhinchus milii TaxID=7868 RepID=A0A4W3IJF4_CALMI